LEERPDWRRWRERRKEGALVLEKTSQESGEWVWSQFDCGLLVGMD
jgi:hypothetical protein